MTTRQLICVDTETNGLDEDLHEPWEIAWHNLNTGEHGQFFVALDVPEFMRPFEITISSSAGTTPSSSIGKPPSNSTPSNSRSFGLAITDRD